MQREHQIVWIDKAHSWTYTHRQNGYSDYAEKYIGLDQSIEQEYRSVEFNDGGINDEVEESFTVNNA